MRKITNHCPGCNKILDIPEELQGRKAQCPYCLCKFIIGTNEILQPPMKTSLESSQERDNPETSSLPSSSQIEETPSIASAGSPLPSSGKELSEMATKTQEALSEDNVKTKTISPSSLPKGETSKNKSSKKRLPILLPLGAALVAFILFAGWAGSTLMLREHKGGEAPVLDNKINDVRNLHPFPDRTDLSTRNGQPGKGLLGEKKNIEAPTAQSSKTKINAPKSEQLFRSEEEKDIAPTLASEASTRAIDASDPVEDNEASVPKKAEVSEEEESSTAQINSTSEKKEGFSKSDVTTVPAHREEISLPPEDARTRDSAGKPARYKRIGIISGIDVMARNFPFTPPKPDAQLQMLLTSGATAFQDQLTHTVIHLLPPQASTQWLKAQVQKPASLLSLTRYKFMTACGVEAVDQVLHRPEGREMLIELLSDQDWLNDVLVTSILPDNSLGVPLHYLCSIYRYDKTSTDPFFRKIAWVIAKRTRGKWESGVDHHRALDAYQAQRQACQEGRIHNSYLGLETWEMMRSYCGFGKRSMDYALKQFNNVQERYAGACDQIAYRLYNAFGDSVQIPAYYRPWQNNYYYPLICLQVGGVCGALSTYGALSSNAHGIPAFPVSQPGHCAYMFRANDEDWRTANPATGNTGVGTQFGGGDESFVRLVQAAYSNKHREKVLLAFYYNWQAEALQKSTDKLFSAAEKKARCLSIKEDPLHLAHWSQLAKRMHEDKTTTPKDWQQFSFILIRAVGLWQRPCWEFLTREVLDSVKKLPAPEYQKTLLTWHKMMPKEGKIQRIGYRFKNHLIAQINWNKSLQVKATLFKELLKIYSGCPEFAMVLEWGQDALLEKEKGSTRFLNAMMDYRKTPEGKEADISQSLGMCIEEAEQRGDLQSFQKASLLANQLYPELESRFLGINLKKIKNVPKQKRFFMGKLLSANAIPMFSKLPGEKRLSFCHMAALQKQGIGYLLSRPMKDPTLTIRLKGRSLLSGLVLAGRFENEKALAESFPLEVESSLDGKQWEHLLTIQEARPIHEIDLHGKNRKAEYLRFSYKDKEKNRMIALRILRIYGQPLY